MKQFWSKVNKNGPVPAHKPELGVCWVWIKGTKMGYGAIKIGGKTLSAHRVSFMLEHGSIPEGMFVLHKCDNRKCVKPTHLYAGTQRQNNQDRARANRSDPREGVLSPLAKLTESQVIEIRRLSEIGISQNEIIRTLSLNVRRQQVGMIVQRKRWKHI